MARRRRRVGGTWFPNVGTQGPEGNDDDDDLGRWFLHTHTNATVQDSITSILDLTFDQPLEDEAVSSGTDRSTLADIVGSEYILRRIVGKLFCFVDANDGTLASQFGALVTCGFFVARAEDSTTEAAGISLPIGTETAAETRENYSPAAVSTVREPWIWRRRWLLGNAGRAQQTGVASKSGLSFFPTTNAGYASVMDGPHIDAKTVRRVSQDDRLWFAASSRILNPNFADPFNPPALGGQSERVNFHLDYRLFGRLVKASARGAF